MAFGNAVESTLASPGLPPIPIKNAAKVQHATCPNCIKLYQSVSKRIKVYPNVSKCIVTYRSVLKRIIHMSFFDVLALNEQFAFNIERFIHSKGIYMRMVVLS